MSAAQAETSYWPLANRPCPLLLASLGTAGPRFSVSIWGAYWAVDGRRRMPCATTSIARCDVQL